MRKFLALAAIFTLSAAGVAAAQGAVAKAAPRGWPVPEPGSFRVVVVGRGPAS